ARGRSSPGDLTLAGVAGLRDLALPRQVHPDVLALEVVLDAVSAELAADPGLLVAAPGRLGRGRLGIVDPHDPGPKRARRPERLRDVPRPDRRREAVVAVVRKSAHPPRLREPVVAAVRQPDALLEVLEGNHRSHRP